MERVQDMKQRLEVYLKARFPQRKELSVVEMERPTIGVSHENYLVTVSWREAQGPVSENLYIRMEPGFGRTVEDYDFTPQYEALKILYETEVPVPKVHWVETDDKLLGRPFGVMEKLEGEVLITSFREHPEHQEQLRKDYVETIAKMHGLDWQALDLSFLGVPETDYHRAEETLTMMEERIDAIQYAPQPVMAELFSWLKGNIPRAERTTFCHGDCHIGNFFARDGRIIAVLDWESASIGDPMLDLGWSCMMMRLVYRDFWDEAEFIRAYEEAAGVQVNKESLFFWEILAFVRLILVGFIGIRTGLESEDLDMRQLGIWPVLVPLLQDGMARMLGF